MPLRGGDGHGNPGQTAAGSHVDQLRIGFLEAGERSERVENVSFPQWTDLLRPEEPEWGRVPLQQGCETAKTVLDIRRKLH
jgi:hypothetical protein